MNLFRPFQKILGSSTAWFGAIVAGVTTWAQTAAIPLPPWVSAALVVAYAIKEAAMKLAGEPIQPTTRTLKELP